VGEIEEITKKKIINLFYLIFDFRGKIFRKSKKFYCLSEIIYLLVFRDDDNDDDGNDV
jgi:hypothetical protein